ncbi:hypothetical protein I203_102394 [Kwoniella mangroviensis CBS 8507]|uniref:uncharacterized protein n=1 Tax=Kwoniella mangroviensis CBS 8507 TaxID=1296122 RepID=UPI00080CC69F|nr:uncharacterized protein I203_06514 [Kwoniella mangroviensis CBS 8507]OCF64333.1 hypothetical protein I203_06514 [Kwoniella mangroviensis CBS 8507]
MSDQETEAVCKTSSPSTTTNTSDRSQGDIVPTKGKSRDDYHWSGDDTIFKEVVPEIPKRERRSVGKKEMSGGLRVKVIYIKLELVDDNDANATAAAASDGMADHA